MKHFIFTVLAVLLALTQCSHHLRRRVKFHVEPATSATDIIQKAADTTAIKVVDFIDRRLNIRIGIGSGQEDLATGYIPVRSVLQPVEGEKHYLTLMLNSSPIGDLASVLVNDSGLKYILPYRITSLWTSEDPPRGKKFIGSTVNKNGAFISVYFYIDDCITNAEAQQLATALNQNVVLSNFDINTYKSAMANQAVKYSLNKVGSDNALKDKPTIEGKIADLQRENTSIASQITQLETVDQPKNAEAMRLARISLQNLNNRKGTLQEDYNNKKTSKEEKEQLIATQKTTSGTNQTNKTTYLADAEAAKNAFNSSQTSLTSIAKGDNADTYITQANSGFTNKDQNTVDTNLQKISSS